MTDNGKLGALLGGALIMTVATGTVTATPLICADPQRNHTIIDSAQVSACLDAGTGNINGNPMNDQFLVAGGTAAGYALSSKDDVVGGNPFNIVTTQTGSSGTWAIDMSFWATHSKGAIGLKFGTGNQPDAWFVYELVAGVSSGNWEFVNVFGKGGGLSHTNLYAGPRTLTVTEVAEPLTFGLALAGFAGALVGRRRSRND